MLHHFLLFSLAVVDIDECTDRPEVCRTNQECRNTIGSYICRNLLTCSTGYELNEGGTRCEGKQKEIAFQFHAIIPCRNDQVETVILVF